MLARFNKEIFSKKNAAFGYVWTRLVLPLRRECCVGLRIHEDYRHLKQKLAKVGSSRQQPRPPLSWPTTGPPPTPFPLLQVSLGRFPSRHLMSPDVTCAFSRLHPLAASCSYIYNWNLLDILTEGPQMAFPEFSSFYMFLLVEVAQTQCAPICRTREDASMGGTSQLPMRSHSAQDVRNGPELWWHHIGSCIPLGYSGMVEDDK